MSQIEQIIAPRLTDDQFKTWPGRLVRWFSLVTELDILSGEGSPEGVVAAKQKRLYMDTDTEATPFFYIKQQADIDGNRARGWRAIA